MSYLFAHVDDTEHVYVHAVFAHIRLPCQVPPEAFLQPCCFVQDMPFVVNDAKTIVVNLDACRVSFRKGKSQG